MSGFSVDPVSLTEFGTRVERREPFGEISAAARTVTAPSARTVSSLAIERFTWRLARDLAALSVAAESLGSATRVAARRYQDVEDSVDWMSNG